MYNPDINYSTLKTTWFKTLLVICCLAQVVTWYIGGFVLWASGGTGFWPLNLLIIYGPALIIVVILTIVGLRLLFQPPIPRPWQAKLGVFVAILAGLDSGGVAFTYNHNQVPYLFYYPVFVILTLLVLDGYMIQFIAWRRSKKSTPRVVSTTTEVTQPSSVNSPKDVASRKTLLIAIVVVVIAQILTISWAYSLLGRHRILTDEASYEHQCLKQQKYPMIHGYLDGKEYIHGLYAYVGWHDIKDAKFVCYTTLDEALRDYPNFYEIVDKDDNYKDKLKSQAYLDRQDIIIEADKIIKWGPIGKEYLEIMWLDKPTSRLKINKVVFADPADSKSSVIPWIVEYGLKTGPGTVVYACAESDNQLLVPKGFDSTKWQTEMKQLDNNLPPITQHSLAYYQDGNRQAWIITYHTHITLKEARNTRCVLSDADVLLTKTEGDAMAASADQAFEHYYPIGSEEGQVVIVKQ